MSLVFVSFFNYRILPESVLSFHPRNLFIFAVCSFDDTSETFPVPRETLLDPEPARCLSSLPRRQIILISFPRESQRRLRITQDGGKCLCRRFMKEGNALNLNIFLSFRAFYAFVARQQLMSFGQMSVAFYHVIHVVPVT